MTDEKFYYFDEETDERFGPFGRLATRDQALARHIETGHFITVYPVKKSNRAKYDQAVACCMGGAFLVEVPHDEDGTSLPCKPWIEGEPEDN